MKLHIIWHFLLHISLHILCHIFWRIMHILHIYAWWYMLQIFVVYFLDFKKNWQDRENWELSTCQALQSFNFSYCLQRGLNPRSQQRNLSPYELSYRSLRESLFHHCFLPQLRAQLFTYHHLHSLCRPLFRSTKRLECWQLLFASRTVSSLYCWLEQKAWRTHKSTNMQNIQNMHIEKDILHILHILPGA